MKGAKPIPPGYVALVQRLAQLIEQWCEREPTLPDLRWLDPGDTVFIGGLQGKALDYLVDSPDARRLCEWLDEQTNREATLFQMTVALRMLGHLPGGPEPEQVRASSPGMRRLEAFAFQTGTDTRHETKQACPHCGKDLDASTGEKGHSPSVGDLSICAYCCGFLRYGPGLALLPLSDGDLDAFGPECAEAAAGLREMRDLIRASKMKPQRGVLA